MKTKKMLISIGIILGFAGSFFAKGAEAIGTKTIEPKLVFEYKFDEPIRDVIFDTATMTVKEARALGMKGLEKKNETENIVVKYPRAIFVGDERFSSSWEDWNKPNYAKLIKFLDKKGKAKSVYQVPKSEIRGYKPTPAWISLSKNRKYISVDATRLNRENWEDSETEYIILDLDGNIFWRAKHKAPEVSDVRVSPNGRYILPMLEGVETIQSEIQILYKSGLIKRITFEELEKEISFKINKDVVIRRWDVGDFSNNGRYCVVWVETKKRLTENEREALRQAIPQGYDPWANRREHMLVFDDEGNEVFKKYSIVEGGGAGNSKYQITDDYVIVVKEAYWPKGEKFPKVCKIHKFNLKGELIESKEVK